jgi:hypothetical protein
MQRFEAAVARVDVDDDELLRDAGADVASAVLREHRRVQAAERLLVGSGWRDHGLVFCRVDGSPLHPERFSARFVDKARLLGLPPIRLHDLRHTQRTPRSPAQSSWQPSAARPPNTATPHQH